MFFNANFFNTENKLYMIKVLWNALKKVSVGYNFKVF